jgi:hypothetical protein
MQVYQQYEEAGTDLGQALSKKETIEKARSMDASIAKALGKLSSGLYVVTAAHADVRSAMIASWVAQASFEPLGLTIAVAKDRAIESLMQVLRWRQVLAALNGELAGFFCHPLF